MAACYCPTAAEAVKKVSELIPDGSSVTWGGSMTIRDMGIPAALHARATLNEKGRDLQNQMAEFQRKLQNNAFVSEERARQENDRLQKVQRL